VVWLGEWDMDVGCGGGASHSFRAARVMRSGLIMRLCATTQFGGWKERILLLPSQLYNTIEFTCTGSRVNVNVYHIRCLRSLRPVEA
jgi:hypothetical protein